MKIRIKTKQKKEINKEVQSSSTSSGYSDIRPRKGANTSLVINGMASSNRIFFERSVLHWIHRVRVATRRWEYSNG